MYLYSRLLKSSHIILKYENCKYSIVSVYRLFLVGTSAWGCVTYSERFVNHKNAYGLGIYLLHMTIPYIHLDIDTLLDWHKNRHWHHSLDHTQLGSEHNTERNSLTNQFTSPRSCRLIVESYSYYLFPGFICLNVNLFFKCIMHLLLLHTWHVLQKALLLSF